MNYFLFLISTLACYRLSRMGALEEGPFAIFKRLRDETDPKTNFGRGIRCNFCWSVWCAALITLPLCMMGYLTHPLCAIYLFAVSGGAVLLHRLDGED